jgi:hypothetical protein
LVGNKPIESGNMPDRSGNMPDRRAIWAKNIARVRQLLTRVLRESAESREPVAEIFDLLEKLDHDFRTVTDDTTINDVSKEKGRYRRNKPKKYQIERHRGGYFLAEHRVGGRQPYLCPRDVYEAFTVVMAETKEPTHFEVLLEAVNEQLGRATPDYLLRVCIRFWMSADQPLIERTRTRYKPVRLSTFASDAKRLWRKLIPQKK